MGMLFSGADNSLFSKVASITTAYYLVRSASDLLIPGILRTYLNSHLNRLAKRFSSELTIVITEFEGLAQNHRFDAANIYLGTKFSPLTERIRVHQPVPEVERNEITVDKDEEIVDTFAGIQFNWVLNSTSSKEEETQSTSGKPKPKEARFFELKFNKKHKDLVLNAYLPHISKISSQIKKETKVLKLHAYDEYEDSCWHSVALSHPACFETIAMEPEAKTKLIEDLDKFKNRKDYYKRVGKAWKRGYLLYGPPGTGKSSLIAAMADYLKFDIYDLDLKTVKYNSELKKILIRSSNKSILVIEDIDCSGVKAIKKRKPGEDDDDDDDDDDQYEGGKITLSGFLNFIDGLWSSIGEERIIVFTTNHKEKLDPALLRPGRMDVHIEMSYCRFGAFKTLARNYLYIEDHQLFTDIGNLLSEVEVSPADVAGQLMMSDDPDTALEMLVKFLTDKKNQPAIPSQEPEKQEENQETEKKEPEKQEENQEAEKQEKKQEAEKQEESSNSTLKPTTLRNKMLQLVKRLRRKKITISNASIT